MAIYIEADVSSKRLTQINDIRVIKMEIQLTNNRYETLPFTYFLVDRELKILSASEVAFSQFHHIDHFLNIVEIESRSKAVRFLLEAPSIQRFELILKTKMNPSSVFDVYVQYEGKDHIHLFCLNKDEELKMVQQEIQRLEQQLLSANLLLVEKKAELENSLQEVSDLVMKNENLATVGKLAASIAHEIRNPLTTVKGFIQLLKPYLTDVGKGEYVDIAIDELNRANDIIYEFLNASKPSNPVKERVLLSKLLSDVMLLCESESILQNCKITYKPSKQDVLVYLDVKQLKQVLINLLKNAMDAIDEIPNKNEGHIHIYTKQFAQSVEIYIEDNGKGIEEEVIPRLFVPFFTTKSKGTGIGLAVCAKIIEAHAGKIEVDSNVGKGTTFKIVLPL
jgi:signal transduction histidine kinase